MEKPCYDVITDRDIPDINVLVAGFPGTGLIGGIASEQLINTLELEQIASINCDKFPPTAVIFDGVPRRPVRFFAGDGIMLVKSDMVIPPELSETLSEAIIDWGMDHGVKEVIIFDGIPEREDSEEENKVWGVLSTHSAENEARELDLDIIERGAIAGISSSMLLYAHEKKLEAVGMLVEGKPKMPDPRAAAKILQKFAKYMDLDIETESLIESAEQLEEQYSKMVAQTKQAQEDMEQKSAHPPLYG